MYLWQWTLFISLQRSPWLIWIPIYFNLLLIWAEPLGHLTFQRSCWLCRLVNHRAWLGWGWQSDRTRWCVIDVDNFYRYLHGWVTTQDMTTFMEATYPSTIISTLGNASPCMALECCWSIIFIHVWGRYNYAAGTCRCGWWLGSIGASSFGAPLEPKRRRLWRCYLWKRSGTGVWWGSTRGNCTVFAFLHPVPYFSRTSEVVLRRTKLITKAFPVKEDGFSE